MPVRETRGHKVPGRRRLHVARLATPTKLDSQPAAEPGAARPIEPPAAGPAGSSGRPTADRARIVAAVVVVLLVAALAALAVTGQRWYGQRQLEAARQAALAAAKQTTVDFVSIGATTVDRDLQRIAAGATGDFKDEFTRGMPQVRTAVVENGVESRGTVLRAGMVSGDRDSAVVLVAVDATVKNVRAPEGRLSHYRIQVDLALDRGSGRWLVSRLQFVG